MAGTVLLAHGSGGALSHELIESVFIKHLGAPPLGVLEDASSLVLADAQGRLPGQPVMTTDSYVVQPIFFPGGDIGKLAVCGTVNDLAMRGATPLFLTAGFILEEGLLLADLERIVASMAATAQTAGVRIVAGDTKVVGRGQADKIFVNTAGIGLAPFGVDISAANVQPGDVVVVNGAMGDHGLTIMTQREGLRFDGPLTSDCAPLNGLVQAMLEAAPHIHTLRDPTRGGLATALCELAASSRVGIEIEESAVPIHEMVRVAGELLGIDPLYAANEGKLIAFIPEAEADAALRAMHAHALGREAAIIGRAVAANPGRVVARTLLGTRRLLDMLAGEPLPRIC